MILYVSDLQALLRRPRHLREQLEHELRLARLATDRHGCAEGVCAAYQALTSSILQELQRQDPGPQVAMT